MAGPAFVRVGTRSQSAGAATLSPAKPTVDGAGGVLLCVVTSKNNATHACATSGWAQVGSQVNSGANFTASLWRAAEGAGAPTITWTGSVACSAQIAYFADPANDTDTTLGAPSTGNGLTSTHATSAVSTTRNNSLAIYIDVAAANTAIAQPSGWTEDVDAGSATDAGRTAWGSKAVASSGSSSGAISVTGANAAWVQFQVELLTGQASNAAQFSKAQVGAWLEPPGDAASFSKVEVGAWLEPPGDAASFSKVEVGAWLDAPNEANFSKVEVGAWLDYVGGVGRRRNACIVVN